MDELKKITGFLKGNIAVISLLIYSISFVNYYIFYKSFNISIFNYIGLNDLIFFTLEYVFKIFLVILAYEFIISFCFTILFSFYEKIVLIRKKKFLLFLKSKKRNRERILRTFENSYKEGLITFKFIIVFFGIFALVALPYKIVVFPAYLVYFIYLLERMSKEKMLNITIPMVTVIIFLSMIFTTLYTSYNKRFEKDEFAISFIQKDKLITTEKGKSSFNYLGETTANIFLYDIEKKHAKIYMKSNISNLEVQNSGKIDEYILRIKGLWITKQFIEMIKEV